MKALNKRHIERMHTDVTFLGFGALEIGRNWGMGKDVERPDEEEAEQVLNTVLNLGINIIDTASAYHRSEERIGKFVSDRRDQYVLASKCGEHNKEPGTYYDFSYEGISNSIDSSLRLLKTDVIDLIQIHFGPDPAGTLDKGETLRAMQDARKAGKVKYLGASIDGELAKRCILSGDFDVMQLGYNLMHQGNAENIALCKQKGMGVLIRSGLGRGLFTSRVLDHVDNLSDYEKGRMQKLLALLDSDADKLTSLALNFLYRNEGISSVLVGTKKAVNLKRNIELLEADVPESVMNAALRIIQED